MATQRWVAISR